MNSKTAKSISSRRQFLAKIGMSQMAVLTGALIPHICKAQVLEQLEAVPDSEQPSTAESQLTSNDEEDDEYDPFWYAREIMGLID